MAPLHPGDPRDEGALADLTAGGTWLTAGAVGLAALALPGSDRTHLAWAERDPLTGVRNRRSFDAAQVVVREDDCLARIGGDELAGVAGARASFAWAVAPEDGVTGAELLERADQRLLSRKRLAKSAF